MIAPNTNIRLLKTPMELNDANTLSFESETDKYNYFNSLPKLSLDGATYQRKEGVLRYPTTSSDTFEDLLQYNYCMYQNASYDNKWFYAYIDDIKYINDGMTELKLRTDTFMTWQNDIVYKQSFIERQHVSDDTFGLHTIPENLELGEYINCLEPIEATYDEASYVCVGVTEDALSQSTANVNPTYGGVASGLKYLIVENSFNLWRLLSEYSSQSKLDNVHEVFMIPTSFNSSPTWIQVDTNFRYSVIPESSGATLFETVTLQRNRTVGINYQPVNKKLLTFPYSYLLVSNNAGSDYVYHYEDFAGQTSISPTINFDILGVPSPGCSIKIVPLSYKNFTDNIRNRNYEYSIMGAKFPIGGWIGDVYTNWLTQNGVNLALNMVGAGSDIINNGISYNKATELKNPREIENAQLNASMGMLSTGGNIASTLANIYQHSLVPYTSNGNSGASDVMFGLKKLAPTFYRMSIKDEMAKVIDDYFTMYGYKVNTLEVINIHKRTYFDYIKTIGCNIIGNIPQKDLEEIRNLFDNGLTIWHNPSYFLDYSVNNSIL